MIQAQELRIGNWVNETIVDLENGGNKLKQTQIDGNRIKCIEAGDTVRGIPLTPEILLIAEGFESFKPYGDYYIGTQGLNWFRGHGLVLYRSYGPDAPYGGFSIDNFTNPMLNKKMEVAYLHQLQNLYFCLAGKDLEITL